MNVIKRKVLSNVFKTSPAVVKLNNGEGKPMEEIPGPRSFPGIGTLLHYLPYVGTYDFQRLPETYAKMHQQYGDIVREQCSANRCIVHIFNPDDMFTIYRSDGAFPRRLSHTALAEYRQMRPHLYSGPGLLPSNGEEWADFRNTFKRTLLNFSNVDKNMAPLLEEVTDDLIEVIPSHLDASNETDLTPLLYRWGLESVAYITTDKRLGCLTKEGNPHAEELIKAAEDTHVSVYKTEVIPINYKKNYKILERAQDLFGTFVEKHMNAFLASETWHEKNCLMSQLFQCEGADKKKVFTMLVDMYLAGIDSSTFTLSFALYHLAENPTAQVKLRQEIMDCLPSLRDRMCNTDKRLRYLSAVFNESLRLNPIAIGNGRILNQDLVLSGYQVKEGTLVILQHQTASKSEKNYKDAEKFIPERWIENKTRNVASSPFGFGFRTCVGKMIAQKEIRIALAKIVRNFEISYHHDPIGSKTMLLNFPDKPLRLRLRRITH